LSNLFERVLANIRNLFNGVGQGLENILTANVGDIFKGELDIFKGFKPEFGVEVILPDFKMPELVMPRRIEAATDGIRDAIADKWAAIARAEGDRADAAMRALEASRPRSTPMPLRKPFEMLAPGALSPAAREKLGLADPFIGAAAAMGRMALSPGERERRVRAARAEKLAKRRAAGATRKAEKKTGAAALAGMSSADRRRKQAEAERRARDNAARSRRGLGGKSPSGAVDILGGIDKTLNSLLNVNKSTDDQLKKGLPARLG